MCWSGRERSAPARRFPKQLHRDPAVPSERLRSDPAWFRLQRLSGWTSRIRNAHGSCSPRSSSCPALHRKSSAVRRTVLHSNAVPLSVRSSLRKTRKLPASSHLTASTQHPYNVLCCGGSVLHRNGYRLPAAAGMRIQRSGSCWDICRSAAYNP